jgi:hypothetical protein
MSENLCTEIDKLKILAKNIRQLSSFTSNNNSMLNYVEITNIIESIKYKFKHIFLDSYNETITNIENNVNRPQPQNQYCDNVQSVGKDNIDNNDIDDIDEDEYHVNTYPNIAEQMENDNDVIMERRLTAHKLRDIKQHTKNISINSTLNESNDSEKISMLNALYRYSDADQDRILKNIFKKAKVNVEKIMGIDGSNSMFNEYLNKEADELLKIWLSVRE